MLGNALGLHIEDICLHKLVFKYADSFCKFHNFMINQFSVYYPNKYLWAECLKLSEICFTKKPRLSLVALMTDPLTLKRRFLGELGSANLSFQKLQFRTFGNFDRLLYSLTLPPEINISTVLVSSEMPVSKN